jgi:hypothetical protein
MAVQKFSSELCLIVITIIEAGRDKVKELCRDRATQYGESENFIALFSPKNGKKTFHYYYCYYYYYHYYVYNFL